MLRRFAIVCCAALPLCACSFYPSNKSVGAPFCAAGEGEIYELAVYQLNGSDLSAVNEARRTLRSRLGRYTGFRCALALSELNEGKVATDLIVWRSREDAEKAAHDLETDGTLAHLFGANRSTTIAGFFTSVPKAP